MTENQILDDFPSEDLNIRPNKSTLLMVCAILIVGFFSYVLNTYYFQNVTLDTLIGIVYTIGRMWAIVLLIKFGTINKSQTLYQLILTFVGIAILGNIFILQHWPYGKILNVIGSVGIPILYIIRYFKKEFKNLLDNLNLLVVKPLGPYFKLQ